MIISKVVSSHTHLVPQGPLALSSLHSGGTHPPGPELLRKWWPQGNQSSFVAAQGTKSEIQNTGSGSFQLPKAWAPKWPSVTSNHSIGQNSHRAHSDLKRRDTDSPVQLVPEICTEFPMCLRVRRLVNLWFTTFFLPLQVPWAEGLLQHVKQRGEPCHKPC